MIKIFKSIDDKFEEIGFIKLKDNDLLVSFKREHDNYIQILDICKKANDECIVFSYDKDLYDNKGIGNTCVALSYYEMKLILKKMKKKGWNI